MSNLVKWTGSKASYSDEITSLFPSNTKNYYEVFLGGGSIFQKLLDIPTQIETYYLSDVNCSLIAIWDSIINDSGTLLSEYEKRWIEYNRKDIAHRKDYFLSVRNNYNLHRDVYDFYFLTRTSYNGLVRYNSKGEYNTSCHFSRSGINPSKLSKIFDDFSMKILDKNIVLSCSDYKSVTFKDDSFVYLDPPYYETKNSIYNGNFDNAAFLNWFNSLKISKFMSYDNLVEDIELEHNISNYSKKYFSRKSSYKNLKGSNKQSEDVLYYKTY